MAKGKNNSRTSRSNYDDDYGVIRISIRGLAIVLGVIFLILGAGAAVFCWGARDEAGHWAKNPTITEWFDYWGKGAPTETEVTLEAGNPLAVTTENSKNMPMTLSTTAYEVNELAEQANEKNSYTVTATVKPEGAFPNAVVWRSDHPDDVTVTPFADNSLKATVTCLRAFESTVKIACWSEYNIKVINYVKVDYLAPLTQVDCMPTNSLRFGEPYTIPFTPHLGTGSITGTVSVQSWLLGLHPDDYDKVKEVLGADFETNDAGGLGDTIEVTSPYDDWGDTSFTREQFNGAYKNSGPAALLLQVRFEYTYNGKVYSTVDVDDIYLYFVHETVPSTDASSIEFDKDHIIFG